MKVALKREDFCCDEIYNHLIGDEHGCEIQFEYDPIIRGYYIPYKKNAGGGLQEVTHCPWCGSKLPKDLNEDWFDVLEEEFNIKDPLDSEESKVPQEFQTDEWWKNRNF